MIRADAVAKRSQRSAGNMLRVCCLAALVVACADSEPVERVFVLTIAKQQVAQDMRVLRVTQGDAVRLRWSTDQPLKLHLHGYDIEKSIAPGQITEFAFKAHASGRFPINVHTDESSQDHADGEHVLVYLEVYPR